MSDGDPPKIWVDHYDLNLGVQGGPQDSLEDVRENFDDLLTEAIERDPKLGKGSNDDPAREVQ